ncbi:MAG: hypothetical protein Q8O56_00940 [Solirubrobacteraceae bacterium]|nr:hypothetical protein [Solirubrobacteraceae bacterium]
MQDSWALALLLVALAVLAGCGNDDGPDATTSAPVRTATQPALATRPAGTGEIVVRGESSPAIHGPFTFEGRYLVRFEQYAPEDAALDFTSQVPFEATLTRREGDPRGAVALVEPAAARSGRRELTIDGRFHVDVSFGDFPYVLRFTPRD